MRNPQSSNLPRRRRMLKIVLISYRQRESELLVPQSPDTKLRASQVHQSPDHRRLSDHQITGDSGSPARRDRSQAPHQRSAES